MISLVRAHPLLNQLYFQSDRVISNRPLYIDALNRYAVWFDGSDDWMVGYLSNIDEGKLTWGFMANDEMVDCPVDSKGWIEYYFGYVNVNHAITFKCEGMF